MLSCIRLMLHWFKVVDDIMLLKFQLWGGFRFGISLFFYIYLYIYTSIRPVQSMAEHISMMDCIYAKSLCCTP